MEAIATVVRSEDLLVVATQVEEQSQALVELTSLELALVGGGQGSMAFF